MKKTKEINLNLLIFFITLIVAFRIFISICFSDYLYPNAHNLFEAMFMDLLPFIVMGVGWIIYIFIIRKYEEIVKKYTNGSSSLVLMLPLIYFLVVFAIDQKELLISAYDEDLAAATFMYLPGIVKSINDFFVNLENKAILGYNAQIFFRNIWLFIVAITMIINLIYLFSLMYRIVKNDKKIKNTGEKVFLIMVSYFVVTINIATINLHLLYFDKNSFLDFAISENIVLAFLDSFYFTFKNFIAIGGNEANSIVAKLFVIVTTCVNLYFFIVFIPMILSKETISIVSNDNHGIMTVHCEYSPDMMQKISIKYVWDEAKPKVVFVGLKPDTSNGQKRDHYTNNLINYLVAKGYGTVHYIHLFNDIKLTNNKLQFKSKLDSFNDLFSKADCIIIGWGEGVKYKNQMKAAEEILTEYSNKVFCFVNNKNKKVKNISNSLNDNIILKKYFND